MDQISKGVSGRVRRRGGATCGGPSDAAGSAAGEAWARALTPPGPTNRSPSYWMASSRVVMNVRVACVMPGMRWFNPLRIFCSRIMYRTAHFTLVQYASGQGPAEATRQFCKTIVYLNKRGLLCVGSQGLADIARHVVGWMLTQ
jgi:hypothetical protein